MSSLQAQTEEQFQICVEFLGPSATILGNANLPMKLENERSSLKVYLQKSSLREKQKQELISKVDLKEPNLQVKVECEVDEQNQGSKVDLQTLDLNVKIEFVEDASTLKFHIKTVD
jgi:hypothetical protein